MARPQRENLRELIVEAAEKRLWHYGIKKTTIDEIASDAGVGKGTVYLYFDSKEDVAIAIMAKYKEDTLITQAEIARDRNRAAEDRIREVVKLPILMAHKKCATSPHAVEVILTLKPHLSRQMRPYFEQEVGLIAEIIEDGNRSGLFRVEDSMTDARTLKQSTMGLLPPYPCVEDPAQIEGVLDNIVSLALRAYKQTAK
ncbi:MAG TPA: TetR/AcrR family transcriptional regulator [Capsulimonadaceae bacterium]|jgi:AcrR family transcriptional regulator